MAALLKLGAKYEAHSLRRKAIDILAPSFPTQFADYITLQEKKRRDAALNLTGFNTVPELFALVLAFEVAAPSLLPYGLHKLQREADTDLTYIVDGVDGREGRLYLTSTLQRALLRGRPAVSRLSRTVVFPTMFDDSCPESLCDAAKLAFLAQNCRPDGYLDPLLWRSFGHVAGDAACSEMIEHNYRVGRQKVWKQLPQVYGLQSWETLEARTLE
jgi:hypothetical protein